MIIQFYRNEFLFIMDDLSFPALLPLPETMISPPPGWQTGFMVNQDGARLRFGTAPAQQEVRAGMVLITGFNEVIDKYFETIRDFTAQGITVYALDWRGQGGSDRWDTTMPQRAMPLDYRHDVRDLHDFCQKIVLADPTLKDKKLFLHGHSMGGHIGLRYLHDHPETFAGMMTTAPMVGLKTGVFPRPLVKAMARVMSAIGLGHRYVPGGDDWRDDALHLEMKRPHSHDPIRRQLHHALYRDHPDWRVGDATFRWLNTAFESLAVIQKRGWFTKIETPVLMAIAGEDHLIDPVWLRRAAAQMPHAALRFYPDAGHELCHEKDPSRSDWLMACHHFITMVLASKDKVCRPAVDLSGPARTFP